MATNAADDFAYIRARMKEIKPEPEPENPKTEVKPAPTTWVIGPTAEEEFWESYYGGHGC